MDGSNDAAAGSAKHRLLACIWMVLAVGVAASWLVEGRAGRLRDEAHLPLGILGGVFLLLAIATWIFGRRAVVVRANVAALSFVILAPIVAEVGLRASFRLQGSPTKDAGLYAKNTVDDDYWILRGRWMPEGRTIAPKRIHPSLGWSQIARGPRNPSGIHRKSLEQLGDTARPKLLFYGDSYVAGSVERLEDRIPDQLDALLPGTDVVHLGVGGYGTDQSYLLMVETIDLAERPFVVMSAMIYDMDRSILRVRDYQKPRVVIQESGKLEVTNVPIDPDPEHFYATAPTSIRSYVASALSERYRDLPDPLMEEKRKLNRKILAATAALAAEKDARLLFVVFHPKRELKKPNWRSKFFISQCEALGIDCFDTRPALLAHIEETGATLRDLYQHNHHNARSNRVISEALAERLRLLEIE